MRVQGSLKVQFSRFHSSDDHQSFVGTAPDGAAAVTYCRGLLAMVPQPPGSGPTAVVV